MDDANYGASCINLGTVIREHERTAIQRGILNFLMQTGVEDGQGVIKAYPIKDLISKYRVTLPATYEARLHSRR